MWMMANGSSNMNFIQVFSCPCSVLFLLYILHHILARIFCFVLHIFSLLLYNPIQVRRLMLIGETTLISQPAPLIRWFTFVKLGSIDQSKHSQDIRCGPVAFCWKISFNKYLVAIGGLKLVKNIKLDRCTFLLYLFDVCAMITEYRLTRCAK